MSPFAKIAAPLVLALSFAPLQIAAAQEAPADVAQFTGKSLYGPKGEKIAPVYKVSAAGVPQLIIDGKLVSVPSGTLSVADGKLSTSLTKKELTKRVR